MSFLEGSLTLMQQFCKSLVLQRGPAHWPQWANTARDIKGIAT